MEWTNLYGRTKFHYKQKSRKKVEGVSGEHRSREFLIQRIRVAVQCHNAGGVMGTFPEGNALEEIYFFFKY